MRGTDLLFCAESFLATGRAKGREKPACYFIVSYGIQGEGEMGTDDKIGVHHDGARRSIDSACAMGEIADEKVGHC